MSVASAGWNRGVSARLEQHQRAALACSMYQADSQVSKDAKGAHTMHRRPVLILLVVIFLAALTSPAHAQTISGVIAGTVNGPDGKPLSAVSITAKDLRAGREYGGNTDDRGYYRILEAPPGDYEVKAEFGGLQTEVHTSVTVTVNRTTVENFAMKVQTKQESLVVNSKAPMADRESPTLSTAFPARQVRDLPILTHDINNLALLAPGVLSVRTFSFASTLVPFAVNGSRGRDNNFIIDSVDNNEPLFGGAASQFTNTDIFSEYTILTNQLKAEFGRNSGGTINAITKGGTDKIHGTLFWFGQSDKFNALSSVEKASLLTDPARFYENQFGGTLGGPIKKDKTFFFVSYQWDRARDNLSQIFPVLETLPTTAGLTALGTLAITPALTAYLGAPSVKSLPGLKSPCFQTLPPPPATGFSLTNPCHVADSSILVNGTPIPYNVFLVPNGNVFDVRDHQISGRIDQRINPANDFYGRYLFDDLLAPRTPLAPAGETAFSDLGLLPDWRLFNRQRTQSLLLNHRYYRVNALNEFRVSYSRIAQQIGAFGVSNAVAERQSSALVSDQFGGFGNTVPAAGNRFSVGRDTRPNLTASNTYQIQDNYSFTHGKHNFKFGANFVKVDSNIRATPGDLGIYIFGFNTQFFNSPGLRPFLTEGTSNPGRTNAVVVSQRFPNVLTDLNRNITGQGRDAVKIKEFGQFYFAQDDWRIRERLTLSIGFRYENFGQPINSLRNFNSNAPFVRTDNKDFAPRVGFAWSPFNHWVVRGGYGIEYDPAPLNIPLLIWQSGPISPFVSTTQLTAAGTRPTGFFPSLPFKSATDINQKVGGCSRFIDIVFFALNRAPFPGRDNTGTIPLINCSDSETVDPNLRNPYVQNFSLSVQRELGANWLLDVGYVGSKGTRLFQRVDLNPFAGWDLACIPQVLMGFGDGVVGQCRNNRLDDSHGDISKTTNGASSTYHGLQVSLTKRMSRIRGLGDFTMNGAYSWSHMIDNASEIFGPGTRFLPIGNKVSDVLALLLDPLASAPFESITPFAQVYNQTTKAERANSAFDRRHRVSVSFLWEPFPTKGIALRGWQLNGVFTVQSGQPFSPLNAAPFSPCADANGDGRVGSDRPDIGSPRAPVNAVALVDPVNNPGCLPTLSFQTGTTLTGYVDQNWVAVTDATKVRFIQRTLSASAGAAGTAGRNILTGPGLTNLDLSLYKTIKIRERFQLQLRWEVYDVFNHLNFGNPIGNAFATDAQNTPGFAYSGSRTPAAVTGIIPENSLDAVDVNGKPTFLSKQNMNASNRRMQFGIRLIF
jgi:hypothetical protein